MILGKWPTWRTVLFYVFIFIFNSLHVSRTSCSSSGETNCVNTTSGNCHSVSVAVSCASRKWIPFTSYLSLTKNYFIAVRSGAGNDSCHVMHVETLMSLFYWQTLHFFEFVAMSMVKRRSEDDRRPGSRRAVCRRHISDHCFPNCFAPWPPFWLRKINTDPHIFAHGWIRGIQNNL
jgi:hypothetical protein